MESSSNPARPASEPSREIQSPFLRLLLVNDKGMVLESSAPFSVGFGVELAFHAPPEPVRSQAKSSIRRSKPAKSEFITSEGIVVNCTRRATGDRDPVYEVTLIFSSLGSQDRRRLQHLANKHRRSIRLSSAPGGSSDLPGAPLPETVLGLN